MSKSKYWWAYFLCSTICLNLECGLMYIEFVLQNNPGYDVSATNMCTLKENVAYLFVLLCKTVSYDLIYTAILPVSILIPMFAEPIIVTIKSCQDVSYS